MGEGFVSLRLAPRKARENITPSMAIPNSNLTVNRGPGIYWLVVSIVVCMKDTALTPFQECNSAIIHLRHCNYFSFSSIPRRRWRPLRKLYRARGGEGG